MHSLDFIHHPKLGLSFTHIVIAVQLGFIIDDCDFQFTLTLILPDSLRSFGIFDSHKGRGNGRRVSFQGGVQYGTN